MAPSRKLHYQFCAPTADLTSTQEESDAESSGLDATDPASRLMTRKEGKALEREIAWREIEIMKAPDKDIMSYVASAQKEEKGWMTWGSVEAIPDDEAAAILANPVQKRSEAGIAIATKATFPPAKTRVVALGDPDLRGLKTAGANGLKEEDPISLISAATDLQEFAGQPSPARRCPATTAWIAATSQT